MWNDLQLWQMLPDLGSLTLFLQLTVIMLWAVLCLAWIFPFHTLSSLPVREKKACFEFISEIKSNRVYLTYLLLNKYHSTISSTKRSVEYYKISTWKHAEKQYDASNTILNYLNENEKLGTHCILYRGHLARPWKQTWGQIWQ